MSSLQVRTSSEILSYMAHVGTGKAHMSVMRLGTLAVMGGMFIGVGTLLAAVVAGGSGLTQTSPGIVKFLFGAMFPLGFIAVVLTGSDLFTSDCASGFLSLWQREITFVQLIRLWGVSYLFNMIGSLLAAWLFGLQTHLFPAGDPATIYLVGLATAKVSHPFWMTVTKGVLANLLVCLATFQGYSARDTTGRMFGLWFPVMAFVTLGMEHSIANQFIIPMAMMLGTNITMGQFLWANLLPATVGNIVGGILFISLPLAMNYLPKQAANDDAAEQDIPEIQTTKRV